MKVVLDTNVLLVILSRQSPFNRIFQELINGRIHLCVTTDILEEYTEMLETFHDPSFAEDVVNFLIELPRTQLITTYFAWNLIHEDPDDNKFVDCAIAANARYLVSEDRHFQVIKDITFPRVDIIKVSEFTRLIGDVFD